MDRPITGYHTDAEGHFVAELSCGHTRHLRHQPPFTVREWVLDAGERARRLGTLLDCVGCARGEIPEGFAAASRTQEFDEATIPEGLKARHRTKPGVFGRIHVAEGRLEYVVCEPLASRRIITPGEAAVIVPEVEHSVRPLGAVRFHVEFWRRGPGG